MSEIYRTFTSESVTQGHPDKVADIVSDAILDAYMAQDKDSHVACETCVTTDFCMVFGEITSNADLSDDDIETIVRRLKEHPRDLLEMAGIYVETEESAVQAAESLVQDVIV